MPARRVEGLPPFPEAPSGVPRMEHLPTIEASIRYWEAIRLLAIRSRDPALKRTATGLKLTYEAARNQLTQAKPPQA